ncbi:MAG: RICIN domain-containing protein [Alphaproteobacteria bacterium]
MLKSTIVFAALVGFASTVMTPAPAYALGFCIKHEHVGSGRGPTRSVAKLAARAKWRFEVLKHGHVGRILWSQAEKKSTNCSRKYYGYKCRARGVACLPSTTIPGKSNFKKIRNVLGRCLEVAGGVNANRTNVQLFDCNGSKSQQWNYVTSNKTIRDNIGGRCLDVARGVNANRTNVRMYDCNGTKSKHCTFTNRKEFRKAMGRCLEIAGGVNANRTNVQIFDCNRTKSQQWTR